MFVFFVIISMIRTIRIWPEIISTIGSFSRVQGAHVLGLFKLVCWLWCRRQHQKGLVSVFMVLVAVACLREWSFITGRGGLGIFGPHLGKNFNPPPLDARGKVLPPPLVPLCHLTLPWITPSCHLTLCFVILHMYPLSRSYREHLLISWLNPATFDRA